MKATTIKLDGDLLQQVESAKGTDQSVTSFVRETLKKEIQRRQVREAAAEYVAFLAKNPQEKQWLVEWEKPDLVRSPKAGRK